MCVLRATHPAQTKAEVEDESSKKRTSNPARGQEEEHMEATEEQEDVKPNCERGTRSGTRKADRKKTTRRKANNLKTIRSFLHGPRERRPTRG